MTPIGGRPRPDRQEMTARLAPQIADSRAAFALIRRRAAEWKIDPDRIDSSATASGAAAGPDASI
jgi:hypothetical protein